MLIQQLVLPILSMYSFLQYEQLYLSCHEDNTILLF